MGHKHLKGTGDTFKASGVITDVTIPLSPYSWSNKLSYRLIPVPVPDPVDGSSGDAGDTVSGITLYNLEVDNQLVPRLQIIKQTPAPVLIGQYTLVLDNRLACSMTEEQFQTTIGFIADCLAVANGQPAHGKPRTIVPNGGKVCGTCQHWRVFANLYSHANNNWKAVGDCAMGELDGVTNPEKMRSTDDYPFQARDNLAEYAGLETRFTHWCAQWQRREQGQIDS